MKGYWYNYKENEFQALAEPPKDFHDYIPQDAPAQNMFNLLVSMGAPPAKAAIKVLSCYIPDEAPGE